MLKEEELRDPSNWKHLWQSNMDFIACENFWDSRATSFDKGNEKKNLQADKLMDKFLEKDILSSEKIALDIGTGTGAYAIPMAKISKHVTTIDIAQNMLDIVDEKAKKECLDNIDTSKLNWADVDLESIGWKENFDLVFASMSPAIHNYEALIKMMEASKGYCYLSAWVKRDFKIEDTLFKMVSKMGEKKAVSGDKIYYAMNILWNMGYYPEVQFRERINTSIISVEDAYESYTKKLMIHNTLDEMDKKNILDYLEKNSENGKVTEEVNSVVASLLWKVG